jgi:hypothetical protein
VTRRGRGKGVRKQADRERDGRVLAMRRSGASFAQIAEYFGMTNEGAFQCFKRALIDVDKESVNEKRLIEEVRLDEMYRRAIEVATGQHPLVSNGRVMIHPDTGEILTDPKPVLEGINTMLRISERRARMLGLDMPVKAEVRHIDNLDGQIEQLMDELVRRGKAKAPRPAESGTEQGAPKALEAPRPPEAAAS